jgi:aminopeptidase N
MSSKHLIYRKDYNAPNYLVDSIDLIFKLFDECTIVENTMAVRANFDTMQHKKPLVLNGEKEVIELVSIECNGEFLSEKDYAIDGKTLTIHNVPESFTLKITNKIEPHKNKALQGLYRSNAMYCTQCEPHGFSRITYAIDRPDVPSRFTTRIEADKKRFPYLLSNGNPIEKGDLEEGRHFVLWQDPFKKPTYLFALVAGDLALIQDTFTTHSGREIQLHIYVEKHNADLCDHAMLSLKQSMKWDEDTFGLEYDLDIYMIVAVSDFNMGAMENKGLNIFNDKYVLAKSSVATDTDFLNIQRVIGHEYFHNWSGNRVTLRDWFELSLKEGLTVYREQEFCADMTSPGVRRIEAAQLMCTAQFAEDASSLAHPIRPDSYMEINNFYTVTIYDKGAEVIRMLSHLLGKKKFRLGMDNYFARFDGEAVSCDDFIDAMEQANQANLEQFRFWYSQVGTPELTIAWHHDHDSHRFTLSVEQKPSSVLGFDEKQYLQIPLKISLLDAQGKLIVINPDAESGESKFEMVLDINKAKHQFYFTKIQGKVTPSLLRDFSAPIKLHTQYTKEDLLFLLKHDSDDFCAWDSAQQLFIAEIIRLENLLKENKELNVDAFFLDALKTAAENKTRDPALTAKILPVVPMAYIMERVPQIDVQRIVKVVRHLRKSIAQHLESTFKSIYQNLSEQTSGYALDPLSMGRRSLKNIALHYLGYLNKAEYRNLAIQQFSLSNNMTDSLAALEALNDVASDERESLFNKFIHQWEQQALVVDKWLALQARADLPGTLGKVKTLEASKYFDVKVPNKVYALMLGFVKGNWSNFHAEDGSGYRFVVDKILEIDQFNPHVSAYLAKPFTEWKRYAPVYQEKMKEALTQLAQVSTLSTNVHEMVVKSLE